MRTRLFCLGLVLLLAVMPSITSAQPCSQYHDCDEDAAGNYGCALDSFQDITAFSNGGWTGTGCGEWQCVNYVRRFYSGEVQQTLGSLTNGYAVNAFANWGDDPNDTHDDDDPLVQYTNGATTVKPAPGDILCFSGKTYGHVGIVKSVGTNTVTMIDQNRLEFSCLVDLSLGETGGVYTLGSFSGNYVVQGWLRDPDYAPAPTYIAQFLNFTVVQEGPYFPGQEINCTMTWKNVGTATWSSTPGASYVELGSCNDDGIIVTSFLFESSLGWLNQYVPCTFTGSVAPNATATFSFRGKIPDSATPGQVPVYFGPVYAGSMMPVWNGNGITLSIAAVQSAPTDTPDIVRRRLNGTGGCVFRVAASDGNTAADFGGWLNLDWIPDAWFLADVHDDGLADLVLVRGDDVYVSKSYDDHFRNPPLLWKSNWGTPTGTFDYLPWIRFGTDHRWDLIHYRAISSTQVRWWGLASTGSAYTDLGQLVSDFGDQSDTWFGVAKLQNVQRRDILFARPNGRQLQFKASLQGPTGTFAAGTTWISSFGFTTSVLLTGDVNGDAYDDMIAITPSGGGATMRVTWAENSKSGSFLAGKELHPDMGEVGDRFAMADVDQDGKCDLAIMRQPPNGMIYWARSYWNASASAWKLNTRQTWVAAFAQGTSDEFQLANVTNQMPGGAGKATPDPIDDPSDRRVVPASLQFTARPNPFNPTVTLSFVLPTDSPVRITVYDLAGRLVDTIENGRRAAGPHTYTWDGRAAASGVYFLTLVTERSSETRKVVLLK